MLSAESTQNSTYQNTPQPTNMGPTVYISQQPHSLSCSQLPNYWLHSRGFRNNHTIYICILIMPRILQGNAQRWLYLILPSLIFSCCFPGFFCLLFCLFCFCFVFFFLNVLSSWFLHPLVFCPVHAVFQSPDPCLHFTTLLPHVLDFSVCLQ